MPEYTPLIYADLFPAPLLDGAVLSSTYVGHTVGPDANAADDTTVNGRFHGGTGDLRGAAEPKPQDTYIFGDAHPTGGAFDGEPFDVVSGTWKSDWVGSLGRYGLLHPDATKDIEFGITTHSSIGQVTNMTAVVGRGEPTSDADKTASSYYCYLEFGANSTTGRYRVEMAYGRPIALQRLPPGQTDWGTYGERVHTARGLPSVEDYLRANGSTIRLKIEALRNINMIVVEVGNGHVLKYAADEMPNDGTIKFYGKNGWASLEIYPNRYAPVTVKKKGIKIPPGANTGSAYVVPNAICGSIDTQTHAASVSADEDGNVALEVTAQTPDSGDGLGGTEPPSLHDVLLYIPPQVARFGTPVIWTKQPRVVQVNESSVWDDNQHLGYTEGNIVINNWDGEYNNTNFIGNYGLSIWASNGRWGAQRVRGLMGIGDQGNGLIRWDTGSILTGPFRDNTCKLDACLGSEVIFDGFHLLQALWILAYAGGFLPEHIMWNPPGFPPYGDGIQGPILASGTGMSPRYRYTPEWRLIDIMLDLIHDQGYPLWGMSPADYRTVPYYLYQDPWGNLCCQPYAGNFLTPVKAYTTAPLPGYDDQAIGVVEEELEVFTSTAQLRTAITLQGLDPLTNNLLHYYEQLPIDNLFALGYHSPVMERSARFSSEASLAQAASMLRFQGSLPVQYVRFRTQFDPNIFAGNAFLLHDDRTLGRTAMFYAVRVDSTYGLADVRQQNPQVACQSTILGRSIAAVSFV